MVDWALEKQYVNCVMEETDESNFASQKVLYKTGFVKTGEIGEEGPLYIRKKYILIYN